MPFANEMGFVIVVGIGKGMLYIPVETSRNPVVIKSLCELKILTLFFLNVIEQSESHNWPTDRSALCKVGKICTLVALASSEGIGSVAVWVDFMVLESGKVALSPAFVG